MFFQKFFIRDLNFNYQQGDGNGKYCIAEQDQPFKLELLFLIHYAVDWTLKKF